MHLIAFQSRHEDVPDAKQRDRHALLFRPALEVLLMKFRSFIVLSSCFVLAPSALACSTAVAEDETASGSESAFRKGDAFTHGGAFVGGEIDRRTPPPELLRDPEFWSGKKKWEPVPLPRTTLGEGSVTIVTKANRPAVDWRLPVDVHLTYPRFDGTRVTKTFENVVLADHDVSYNDWYRDATLVDGDIAIRLAVSFANDGFVRDQPTIPEGLRRVRVTVYDNADIRSATHFATMCKGDPSFCR